jgi:hypothetical protein
MQSLHFDVSKFNPKRTLATLTGQDLGAMVKLGERVDNLIPQRFIPDKRMKLGRERLAVAQASQADVNHVLVWPDDKQPRAASGAKADYIVSILYIAPDSLGSPFDRELGPGDAAERREYRSGTALTILAMTVTRILQVTCQPIFDRAT